jgi:uncharacterized protein YecE (DUF72 family)
MTLRIATAGWSVPRIAAESFDTQGSHLERYARVLGAVEIDTSFYRPHQRATYERWAASTPRGFRFAVKMPRTLTHEARLQASPEAAAALAAFLDQVGGLGDRLGPLLVQLPPSLAFDGELAAAFFERLRARFDGAVVCEPRHRSWFEPAADDALVRARVSRVAADPAVVPQAARPGGWLGRHGNGVGATPYYRWHGSPVRYRSGYGPAWVQAQARALSGWARSSQCWCVFDNTMLGQATVDALQLADVGTTAADGRRRAYRAPVAGLLGV